MSKTCENSTTMFPCIPPPCYEPDCSTCPYAQNCRKSKNLKVTWQVVPYPYCTGDAPDNITFTVTS